MGEPTGADTRFGAGRPLVPVHPEPVDGDARAVRWVMAPGTLTFVGPVATVPASMQVLLDDGTLTSMTVEPTSVTTWLGGDRGWRAEGARVRSAVQTALALPAQWSPVDSSRDDVLRMAAREVIDGDVGDYIRSHGGQIELLRAHDDRVAVRLSGACTHCPASDVTVSARYEAVLRRRYPDLVAVTTESGGTAPGPRTLLGFPRPRR